MIVVARYYRRRSLSSLSRSLGIWLLALSLAAAPLQAPRAQVRLPALGESASEDFSVSTEKRIGEQIMREIRRDPDYLDEPVLLEYLQSIWQPLVAAARARGDIEGDIDGQFAWESFLVRDRAVNAFALPGGYVGVNLGLISITSSRDELASVLAHELSHVTQRHIARSVVNSQKASMIGLATLLIGLLAAARTNSPDAANAAIAGSQATAIQGQLNFSRDMEREADRMGYGVLGTAGFATAGMASMFEKMDSANRLNDSGNFPYLRSHPLTVERVSEARSRALFAGSGTPSPPLLHALMQMRARVLMSPDPQTLRRLQEQAGGVPGAPLRDRLAALYAGALAASLLREHAAADGLAAGALALAQQASPREPRAERALRLLQVQLSLARGDAAAAMRTLDTLELDANTRAPLLLRAQAALDLRQQSGDAGPALRQSTEALQTWLADHPSDAGAWGLLGDTADAIGLRLRSLRAKAEARAAVGDLSGAIDRLRAAQSMARGAAGQDFIEASVIDARMRELQGQRRQLVLEARGGRGQTDNGEPLSH
jgi:beta-barrel assembly-enhancing protease